MKKLLFLPLLMGLVLISGCVGDVGNLASGVGTDSIMDLVNNPESYGNRNVSAVGLVDKVGNEYYLFSSDLRYKIRLSTNGAIPPLTSDACGILSFPMYKVVGKIGMTVPDNTGFLVINDYTMLNCVSASDYQR